MKKYAITILVITLIFAISIWYNNTKYLSGDEAIAIASDGLNNYQVIRMSLIEPSKSNNLSQVQEAIGKEELPRKIWFVALDNNDNTEVISVYIDASNGEILKSSTIAQ